MNNLLTYHNIEKKVDEIVRNESKSDYEKKLAIMTDVVGPLLDEVDSYKKKYEKEKSDAGWEREVARQRAWLERGDDGLDWMRMP